MINYNPKEWFTFIFRFTSADTFTKLWPLLLTVSVYAGIIAYLEMNFVNAEYKLLISNVGMVHSVLGFVISLLLVFRTNTAYDRWWEGRKVWGSLVNSSRNLALKLNVMLPEDETTQRSFFRKIIPAYAYALHNHLHKEQTRMELFEGDEHKH